VGSLGKQTRERSHRKVGVSRKVTKHQTRERSHRKVEVSGDMRERCGSTGRWGQSACLSRGRGERGTRRMRVHRRVGDEVQGTEPRHTDATPTTIIKSSETRTGTAGKKLTTQVRRGVGWGGRVRCANVPRNQRLVERTQNPRYRRKPESRLKELANCCGNCEEEGSSRKDSAVTACILSRKNCDRDDSEIDETN
jgi:hypothetical protein